MTIVEPRASSPKAVLVCAQCGTRHPKWAGRCGGCGAWNALVDDAAREPISGAPASRALGPLSRLADVDAGDAACRATAIDELDRVLGGGLVPGSVTLLGGEPGIGKSTLAMQLTARWSGPTLYVSGEESPQQVKQRALRIAGDTSQVWVSGGTALRQVLDAVEQVSPELLVVDSIQTLADERVASSPGSPAQVRECAQQLVTEAKRRAMAVVLVGHVTKDGALAGPRALEHVVDTVLSFEGERHHALRLLRAVKHRFGATDELGLFEMTGDGLEGVPDPGHLFLSDRLSGVAGSTVVPAMEGRRPLLVEVQALTVHVPSAASARRTTQGLDSSRLAMLLAVIERRVGIRVADADVYASTVGGVRLLEPGTDLGVALAVVSALTDVPVARDVVMIGEVGLAGEVRQVAQSSRRLAEAARLGYRRAIAPHGSPQVAGIELVPVHSLADAVVRAMGPARGHQG